MVGPKVAARYAQSLLELSEEQQKTDIAMQDMKFFVAATKENRDFAVFLASPIINPDKKVTILKEVFKNFDVLSLSFITLITKKGRESYLPLIAETFISKVKSSRGIIPVTLSSARPLDHAFKKDMLSRLEGQINGTFEVQERIDESLLGGFVFRMGDTQIEASVARQFKELKQRLTK